jgi:hypothetical protein
LRESGGIFRWHGTIAAGGASLYAGTLSAFVRGAMNYYNDKRTAFVVMVLLAIAVFLLLFAHWALAG